MVKALVAPIEAKGPAFETPEQVLERIRQQALEEISRTEQVASVETVKKLEAQKRLVEFIQDRPDEATTLVRTWLYEEK
jgi:flagellar biosynthesis/type III secretory pathway M-ring protein FliF/YscJ